MKIPYALSALSCLLLLACDNRNPNTQSTDIKEAQVEQARNLALWPSRAKPALDATLESNITALLETMTVEQKVGQIIQPEIRHVSPEDTRDFFLGSVLNGGGSFPQQNKHASLQDWLNLADGFYQGSMQVKAATKIPAMWGTDAVHGHNNVIGATLFPHNIALGAANNPALIEAIGAATAKEMAATGISWSFAPTIAVARDDRWGRTYESYSEDPAIVSQYAKAMVNGLQGHKNSEDFLGEGKVIATAKHFIADGGTSKGIDRGDANITEQTLIDIHGQGYFSALDAGVQVVMASFSSWNGDKLHGHRYLLTDVLKDRLAFDGFVIGDWAGHAFIPGCTDTHCPEAVNAGVDMLMAPDGNWKELFENTVEDAQQNRISQARLDDAVRRILRVKLRAGLFEKGAPSSYPLAGKTELIGADAHRAIARQAVRESVVLLKNSDQLLPLKPNQKILVTGNGANDIGKQTGGWTISWQGTGNTQADFPGATSIYQAIDSTVKEAGGSTELSEDGSYTTKPDIAIVVFGEDPYAEMQGDLSDLGFRSEADLALLTSLQAQDIPVVALFITGRPLATNAYINASDAFAVIWQPGTEALGISDVLFSNIDGSIRFPFTGKLSFSWPKFADQVAQNRGDAGYDPQFPLYYGLTNGETDATTYPLPVIESDVFSNASNLQAIFQQRTFSPWTLRVIDNAQSTDLNGASLKTEHLSVKTVDRFVQEDALSIRWSGAAKMLFESNEPVDLSRFAKGRLVFDLQWQKAAPVALGLNCGDECKSVELSQYANADNSEWQEVSVPVACFGSSLKEVNAPFSLNTATEASLVLYNIRLEAGDVNCQQP